MGEQRLEFRFECRVVLRCQPRLFEVQQQRHQRFSNISAAEGTEMAGLVRAGAKTIRGGPQWSGSAFSFATLPPRTAAMKAAILSRFLRPGASSTPEDASTKAGVAMAIARATLSGVKPPARPQGRPIRTRLRSRQSKATPAPPGLSAAGPGRESNSR